MTDRRKCKTCGAAIKGRSDKKFCDDGCRTAYNNQIRGATDIVVRRINSVLAKNRRILKQVLPNTAKTIQINKERLLQLGFSFHYITHSLTTESSKTYYFCYEYGYLPLKNNFYLIVKQKIVNP